MSIEDGLRTVFVEVTRCGDGATAVAVFCPQSLGQFWGNGTTDFPNSGNCARME
jgi:hypothetical protein